MRYIKDPQEKKGIEKFKVLLKNKKERRSGLRKSN